MQTFRLDSIPHQVPGTWAELLPAQFLAASPFLGIDTPGNRYWVLRIWCLELTDEEAYGLTAEQLWDLTQLVGWAYTKELDTGGVTEFTHGGRTYRLPLPQLGDTTAVEYGIALVYFRRFAHLKHPQPLELEKVLNQMTAALCRVRRPDWQSVQEPWEKQFSSEAADGLALELTDAPVGIKLVVMYHFICAQRRLDRAHYGQLVPADDGMEVLELLASLAADGQHGPYEQLANTGLFTLLSNLAEQARSRRAVGQA